jgi:hypothetical protein
MYQYHRSLYNQQALHDIAVRAKSTVAHKPHIKQSITAMSGQGSRAHCQSTIAHKPHIQQSTAARTARRIEHITLLQWQC